MSHELRTPLNAIIGYTSLLDEEVYGPVQVDQHQYLGRIKISAQHLLSLINEVLTFSRLDAGQERIYWEEINSDVLLDRTIILTTPLADMKQLTLTTRSSLPPLTITSDFGKILQILVNLITNAIKFTDRGEVRLSVYADNDRAYFTVRDTGIGIPAVHLHHIFDAFWQVDQGSTRQIGGTGLGLSVSRKLARLSGGDLTVQSTLGQGSTFTLSLPLAPTEELPQR